MINFANIAWKLTIDALPVLMAAAFLLYTAAVEAQISGWPDAGGGEDADLVAATLITETPTAAPGSSLLVGVHLEMEENWYIYWQNPGDSGIPTSVEWDLPDGYTMGKLKWPWPTNFYTDSFVSHGYSGDVVLMAELNVPGDAVEGDMVELSASVNWLVCKDICIPGRSALSHEVIIAEKTSGSVRGEGELQHQALFDKFRSRLPATLPDLVTTLQTGGNRIVLQLHHEGLNEADPSSLVFYAADEGVVESGAEQQIEVTPEGLRITLKKSVFANSDIQTIRGVLYNADGWEGNGMKAIAVSYGNPYE